MDITIASVNTVTTELEAKCDLCGERTVKGDTVFLCSFHDEEGMIFSGVCCHTCMDENDPDEEPEDYWPDMSDVEADADTLASAGWGTDEDYGYFGGDEY